MEYDEASLRKLPDCTCSKDTMICIGILPSYVPMNIDHSDSDDSDEVDDLVKTIVPERVRKRSKKCKAS